MWELAEDTFILRRSLCTSYEGPFLHLLLGEERTILFDSGHGGILVEPSQAVEAMGNNPVIQPHDDFIVYPL